MIHLRTDLPIVPDQETDDWVQDIIENTHYHDLQILRQRLDEAIQSNDNEMTNLNVTKKCTKCDKEYPEFIDKCKCGNTNLETVEIHYNIYLILKSVEFHTSNERSLSVSCVKRHLLRP